ncbi:MAG: hypothetical protein HC897_09970, partial [Thermoanaerobaculia bacterium]|nr:hypothetical protein [Thermoanaerobaculia bacterium]
MTLAELLAYFAVLHKTLLGVNAVASAVMAAVLLGLYYRVVREQHWLRYFGFAYSVIFLQYLSYWLGKWLGGGFEHLAWLSSWGELILNLGSVVNNILFFAAAVALLGFRRVWNYSFCGISLLGLLATVSLPDLWNRIPAAVLSFTCFGLLGWALYVNLRDMGERLVAYFFLGCVWLYAGTNLADATLPWLAQRPIALHTEIAGIFHTIPQGLKENLGGLTVLNAYDTPLFALVLALKVALFGAALLLIVQSLVWIKPVPYRKLLRAVTDGTQQFLSSEGIVQAIAENFNADAVKLCLRAPGQEQNKVVWHRWKKGEPKQKATLTELAFKTFEVTPTPGASDSLEGAVLASGNERRDSADVVDARPGWWNPRGTAAVHTVCLPIRYHCSIIGTLTAERTGRRPFNETGLRNVRQMADFLAPLLQAQRHLAAMHVFATELPALEALGAKVPDPLSLRVDLVHNTLAPLATGIALDIGFKPMWAARNDESRTPDQPVDPRAFDCAAFLEAKTIHLAHEKAQAQNVEIHGQDLSLGRLRIGFLRLAYAGIATADFDRSRASLGQNEFHRRTIAALLTDAILDSVRMRLGSVTKDLLLAIYAETFDSPQRWIDKLARGARAAGLLWAAAQIGTEERVWGETDGVKLPVTALRAGGGGNPTVGSVIAHPVEAPVEGGAHHVIHLPLHHGHLWLGVQRKGFGPELQRRTPWASFLKRLAEAADASLVSILARKEVKRMAEDQNAPPRVAHGARNHGNHGPISWRTFFAVFLPALQASEK